ncbi:MAG: radical SAM protein [bacterium]|nr:radical SAM protein [bacterium]
MRGDSQEKALKRLKNRIKLCSRGITLPPGSKPVLHLQSKQGGAGPQGVASYVGESPGDHSSQISLLILPEEHYLARYALPTCWVENQSNRMGKEGKRKVLQADGEDIFLEKVPNNWRGILPNGRKTNILSKARFHPYGTFSICLYRNCRHLESDEGCKYCTANLLINKLNFYERLPDQENLDYLTLAMAHNPIRSVTLTSGTFESPEKTTRELISQARLIKEKTALSIHVQIEPIFDPTLMKELSQVSDSIGIFLEFFDERIRRQICPGKAKAFSQEDYLRSWELAVACFGWGKVFTTNILGFDDDYELILRGIEKAAKVGVMTSLLWLRVGSPQLGEFVPSYLERDEELLVQLHLEAGKILVENSVDSLAGENSGCLGCHGCNAIGEAISWARLALQKSHKTTTSNKSEAAAVS